VGLLQLRFEGNPQRFDDEQPRVAAEVKRNPCFFGGGREWPSAGAPSKPCWFGCERERDAQRLCEEPSPSSTGGNADGGVSLRSIKTKNERTAKRASILKIVPVFSFEFSQTSGSRFSFSGRQELSTDLEGSLRISGDRGRGGRLGRPRGPLAVSSNDRVLGVGSAGTAAIGQPLKRP
jgi:hypothetical protein